MPKAYHAELTPLTHIHVGTGDSISPGEYFLLPQNPEEKMPSLCVCNLGTIPEEKLGGYRQEILKWIDANPITWVSNVTNSARLMEVIKSHSSYTCKISPAAYKNIKARWGKPNSELAIATTHRTIEGPIIPGSSIKGAIRTALIYARLGKSPAINIDINDERWLGKWERKVLDRDSSGSIDEDLLSALRVSDTQPSRYPTYVLLPKHIGMADTSQELQDYRECIPRANLEKPYWLKLSLRIADDLLEKREKKPDLLSLDGILEACRKFYSDVLEAEIAHWEKEDTPEKKNALEVCLNIKKMAEKHPNAALLRLGWGCGKNSVGINIAKPHDSHPAGRVNERFRHYPKTRVLIADCPPGWMLLRIEGK